MEIQQFCTWPSILTLSFISRGPLASGFCHCLRLCVCVRVQLLLFRAITHHPLQLDSLNLDQMMQNILLKVPIVWGLIKLNRPGQIELHFQVLFICIAFASLKYLRDLQKRMKTCLFHILNGCTHMCSPKSVM